jgi:hypothetical protein
LILVAGAALPGCGGSDSPTGPPTPAPTPTPVPTPTPAPLNCSPTPPPLRYVKVKVHEDQGYRKVLDSKPIVQNVDDYCARVGVPGRYFCDTRLEGDPQRVACDYMAMGRAKDTGRYGPTWAYDGKPCAAGTEEPGCSNHQTNQFLVVAKGAGEFEACAAEDVPLDPVEGSRCGLIKIEPPPAP